VTLPLCLSSTKKSERPRKRKKQAKKKAEELMGAGRKRSGSSQEKKCPRRHGLHSRLNLSQHSGLGEGRGGIERKEKKRRGGKEERREQAFPFRIGVGVGKVRM